MKAKSQLNCFLDIEVKQKLDELAKSSGISMTSLIDKLINDEYKNSKTKRSDFYEVYVRKSICDSLVHKNKEMLRMTYQGDISDFLSEYCEQSIFYYHDDIKQRLTK